MKTWKRAKSRRLLKKVNWRLRRLKVEGMTLGLCLLTYFGVQILSNAYIFHPVKALASGDREVETVVRTQEVVKTVEVDRRFTTEHQQIMAYIIEKFGDRSSDAFVMLDTCENGKQKNKGLPSMDPHRINTGNNNGTWDVGVFQVNVDPSDTVEVQKLQDWKYNIDQAYKKYKDHNNTFYLWSCGDKAGDYTYKMKIEGK